MLYLSHLFHILEATGLQPRLLATTTPSPWSYCVQFYRHSVSSAGPVGVEPWSREAQVAGIRSDFDMARSCGVKGLGAGLQHRGDLP